MRRYLRNIYLGILGSLRKPSSAVHIISSHFVTPYTPSNTDVDVMDGYLSFLSKFCELISIQEATRLITTGVIPKDHCRVAFTFDDGFEECYTTIAPALERYGCNAAFFLNSNYIESDEKYRERYNQRINVYNKKPMSWNQVIDLHRRGHVIGAHTLDHLNMSELNDQEIETQLIVNKRALENILGYDCDYFAWAYGRFQHFPKRALRISQKYYKYIFSGTDYKNYFSYNGSVINRRHIEAFWPQSHIKYFLSTKKKYA